MATKQEMLLKELVEAFNIESAERIQRLTDGLMQLEKVDAGINRDSIVEALFREYHSLKGAARSIDRTDVERICHSAESIFGLLKRKELNPVPELIEILFGSVDCIKNLIHAATAEAAIQAKSSSAILLEALNKAATGIFTPVAPIPAPIKEDNKKELPELSGGNNTIRVSLATLDNLMNQVEELRAIKLMAHQQNLELINLCRDISFYQKEVQKHQKFVRYVRRSQKQKVSENKAGLTNFTPITEKIVQSNENNFTFIKSINNRISNLSRFSEHYAQTVGMQVDSLFWGVKKLLMLPFSSAMDGLPKIVRDLSNDQGKQIDIEFDVDEIDVDKRILDEIKAPLIHLIRNCIDHGIETPTVRINKGKSPNASIKISVSQKSGQYVEIKLADNGSGIDANKLRETFKKNKIIPDEKLDKLSDIELLPFIFLSGISTKTMITDISGRGLGLAIVRETAEKLGGNITFETKKDIGTTFTLTLPIRLAAFRGVLVSTNKQLYILPSANIERVLLIKIDNITTMENREVINVNGEMISLVNLCDVISSPRSKHFVDVSDKRNIVILHSSGVKIAFIVDEIIGEQELLVKNLGRQLLQVKDVIGAAALGDGKLVLILDALGLLNTAVHTKYNVGINKYIDGNESLAKKRKILVAEDSLTSRLLLKNILESAGYDVKTAMNGADAFEQLVYGDFNLLVSDVDMPRMNGFILTEKVRSDKRLTGIPVVLVTSLESREDRERGIDAGANAYLVKKGFDQDNLLEIVSRLI